VYGWGGGFRLLVAEGGESLGCVGGGGGGGGHTYRPGPCVYE